MRTLPIFPPSSNAERAFLRQNTVMNEIDTTSQAYIHGQIRSGHLGRICSQRNRITIEPRIKICDAVDKEEPMDTGGNNERPFTPWLAL